MDNYNKLKADVIRWSEEIRAKQKQLTAACKVDMGLLALIEENRRRIDALAEKVES